MDKWLKQKISIAFVLAFTAFALVFSQYLSNQNQTFDPRGQANTTIVKPYAKWWPAYLTPWAYEGGQMGGLYYMNYNRATQFSRLESEFNSMITTSKPSVLVIMASWNDLQPFKFQNGLPEGTKKPSDLVDTVLKLDYFDDLVLLSKRNGINPILYPIVSGYGGYGAYPFSYYSKSSWFWKRPDWPYGLANPATDAMRHPPAAKNGSNYDWCEHEAGYVKLDCTARHFPLTANGKEPTGIGDWQVFESPDMVFNGYDSGSLLPSTLHIHSPIPSFSSIPYRTITKDLFKRIAAHFKDKGIGGYFLFQEPSYAHLRENMAYTSGFSGNTGAGDSRRYEVDYSEAERIAYNEWGRAFKGFTTDRPIPYPVDATYNEFRTFNLAGFQVNLKDGLKIGDPNAKILLSIFEAEEIQGLGSNPAISLQVIKPDIVAYEPPFTIRKTLADSTKRNALIQFIKRYSPGTTRFMSLDSNTVANYETYDSLVSADFARNGFTEFWTPVLMNFAKDPSGYAFWGPNTCAGCTFRYRVPGTAAPSLPINLRSTCSSATNRATISWTAATGATRYIIRIDNKQNPWSDSALYPGDYKVDNLTSTSYSFPYISGVSYTATVQAANAGGIGEQAQLAAFSCNTPTSTPTPTKAPIATATPTPTVIQNIMPQGRLESFINNALLKGWAFDKTNLTKPVEIHFYVNNPVGQGGIYAGKTLTSLNRVDVNSAYNITGNHGFEWAIPQQYRTSKPISIFAYALDTTEPTRNTLLQNSPFTFTVITPTPSSTKAPTNTPTTYCAKKQSGDANCDNLIDLVDFSLFREEYLAFLDGEQGIMNAQCDFNKDQQVDLLDFEIFRSGYLVSR